LDSLTSETCEGKDERIHWKKISFSSSGITIGEEAEVEEEEEGEEEVEEEEEEEVGEETCWGTCADSMLLIFFVFVLRERRHDNVIKCIIEI